ncbi:MAG: potassium-transporting ATPase subunit KdpC [Thermoleophilia bacterium]
MRYIGTALRMTIVTAIILGILYPLAVTGLAQAIFPSKADGSLVRKAGQVVGSTLIAQAFTAPGYFHPRPSAAGSGYDAMASSPSNLGPTSKVLMQTVQQRVTAALAENPSLRKGSIPVDMVTASGSGLDPDITVANARAQAARVAAARGKTIGQVLTMVTRYTSGRQLGFLGEPRVNVLELNLALDTAWGPTAP